MQHFSLITAIAATALAVSGAHAQPQHVFIPEGSANTVRVVDAATGDTLARITGLEAVHGLSGAAGTPYLVAGSYSEVAREDVVAMSQPEGVSQDEHAAHHAKPAKRIGPADAGLSLLSVIDIASGEILRRIEVPGAVHHTAVSPDGRYAVATHPSEDGISVVDLNSFKLIAWVATGPQPNYAAFGADSGAVYVSNAGNGTISEVDLNRGIVRRNLIAGAAPEHMVIDRTTDTIYAADADAGVVVELSLPTGAEKRVFEIGGEIHGLDLSDDGQRLFVAGKESDTLAAVDLGTGRITKSALAPAPYHLTTIPGTGTIFVSSRDEPKVWIVDSATLTPRSDFAIEGEGHQMVALP
jgi:outer membrane protein assembly factor BamB